MRTSSGSWEHSIRLQPKKVVLIFGGTGSLGKALIRRMLPMGLTVVAYSRDEAKHWTLRNEYHDAASKGQLKFIVGDIRDRTAVTNAIRIVRPDHIIIASALKQVDTCERQPYEAIETNVVGPQNVVEAVIGLDRECSVCFISTDKACSPVNVYGMCKATAERVVTSRSIVHDGPAAPRFFAVRYGNVLNSRGSVIPLFQHQARDATRKSFTVTHSDMTRFLMTLDDSVDLIFDAIASASSGETWVPKLQAMRIIDLANIFAKRYGKRVDVVGIRPGEKLDEALINDVESLRRKEVVGASGRIRYVIGSIHEPVESDLQEWYTSADELLTYEQLDEYLDKLGLVEEG